jgi:hypothetical protein
MITEHQSAVNEAIQKLSSSSMAYLISSDPIPTASRIAHNSSQPITPAINAHTIEPKTKNEVALVAALREAEAEVKSLKARVVELQATNVVNEMYCNTLRLQLAHKQDKAEGSKGKGKL